MYKTLIVLNWRSAVAQNKMANVLLAYKGRNRFGGYGQAAEDIARSTAREALGPLLDAACARLANVLRRCYDISSEKGVLTGLGRHSTANLVFSAVSSCWK